MLSANACISVVLNIESQHFQYPITHGFDLVSPFISIIRMLLLEKVGGGGCMLFLSSFLTPFPIGKDYPSKDAMAHLDIACTDYHHPTLCLANVVSGLASMAVLYCFVY